MIKLRKYLPSVNLSLKSWFSEAAVHRCFTKQVFLKISQYSQEKTCAGRCIISFTEHLRWLLLDFRSSKYFFQLNLVFIADSNTCFCPELMWKHELNVRSSHRISPVKKRCFQKFCRFHRKTTVLKSLFNTVADLQACSFIKNRLQHRCFPVEFTRFLRTPKLKSANACF